MEHEVYYLRRRNLGNYEHAEASMRINVKDAADIDAAFDDIKACVHKALDLPIVQKTTVQSEKPAAPAEEDYGKPAPNPVVEKTRETNAIHATNLRAAQRAAAKPDAFEQRMAEEAARETAELAGSVPSAVEMHSAMMAKHKALGGTSVEVNRIKDLVRDLGTPSGDYSRIPDNMRQEFLRRLGEMK